MGRGVGGSRACTGASESALNPYHLSAKLHFIGEETETQKEEILALGHTKS